VHALVRFKVAFFVKSGIAAFKRTKVFANSGVFFKVDLQALDYAK
jgi:hypothetical protein